MISPDTTDILTATPMALTDKNLYAYCDNNPVIRADNGGEFWHIVVGAAVGVVTQYVADVVTNLASGSSFVDSLKPRSSWVDYLGAATSGALAATGIGLVGSVAANAAIGGAAYLGNSYISGNTINTTDLALSVGVGAASGLIGGKGADGAKIRGVYNTSKQVLKTAVSPRKIAQYTAKITKCTYKVVEAVARTVAAGFASNAANNPEIRKAIFKEMRLSGAR